MTTKALHWRGLQTRTGKGKDNENDNKSRRQVSPPEGDLGGLITYNL